MIWKSTIAYSCYKCSWQYMTFFIVAKIACNSDKVTICSVQELAVSRPHPNPYSRFTFKYSSLLTLLTNIPKETKPSKGTKKNKSWLVPFMTRRWLAAHFSLLSTRIHDECKSQHGNQWSPAENRDSPCHCSVSCRSWRGITGNTHTHAASFYLFIFTLSPLSSLLLAA